MQYLPSCISVLGFQYFHEYFDKIVKIQPFYFSTDSTQSKSFKQVRVPLSQKQKLQTSENNYTIGIAKNSKIFLTALFEVHF